MWPNALPVFIALNISTLLLLLMFAIVFPVEFLVWFFCGKHILIFPSFNKHAVIYKNSHTHSHVFIATFRLALLLPLSIRNSFKLSVNCSFHYFWPQQLVPMLPMHICHTYIRGYISKLEFYTVINSKFHWCFDAVSLKWRNVFLTLDGNMLEVALDYTLSGGISQLTNYVTTISSTEHSNFDVIFWHLAAVA